MSEIPLHLVLILFFLLILSAFFSSAETAYSSANKMRLKSYADENRSGGAKAYHIAQHFDHALSTILIGNNLVNIAAATISAQVATAIVGGNTGLLISTIVMTILILVFGEVLPKSLAKENAESFALKISVILLALMKLFTPVTWLLVKLKEVTTRYVAKSEAEPSVTEEELKEIFTISHAEGVLDPNEKELLHNTLDFNDIKVVEIQTPRTELVAIDVNSEIEEITALLIKERFSRVPVYEDTIDNIIGILSERDFLTALVTHGETDIRTIMRKPYFVVETLRIAKLLPMLQKDRAHMAIVIDEFGGTSGIITLEDILEELVGEIWDEHDEKIKDVTELGPNEYEFFGDYPLDQFARMLEVELPDSRNHTLGGWLTERFHYVPTIDEEIIYDGLKLTITDSEDRRVKKVKVSPAG
ncbi:CorC_HlyC and CBS domain transporter [Alkalihalophilus pseudofirmus OF4]|uniref:CorC_HlyC and CBS domain transporter n=1 Tax=Alkalihalophilus pseudofirmus (strain ATCC BAA-2126 / JCM 17055 / OF4) TaxID=398511 RepID=D3FQP6_ALKPO|nr:hemolysin family protein [Alkalihalophilus pseudofirmus]ADC51416.1 CorC_HlyC and CBS domain transporter [Alkalihalophilus pseudofirmus OF4]